jgi:hypothetical protein
MGQPDTLAGVPVEPRRHRTRHRSGLIKRARRSWRRFRWRRAILTTLLVAAAVVAAAAASIRVALRPAPASEQVE